MNTDFRVSVDFFNHHKARKLRKRLGCQGLLSLLQLWAYAAKLRTDGRFSGMSSEDIELAAEWEGEEGTFTTALLEAAFLEQDDQGYFLHDWAENNPWAAEEQARSEKARKGAQARWGKAYGQVEHDLSNAPSKPKQCVGNAQAKREHDLSNAPSPSPIPKPKDIRNDSSLRSESTPAPPEAATGEQPPPMQPVITLPLNTGEEYPIVQGQIEQWQDLYPAVNVAQALRNMRGWLLGNPRKKKTKSGVMRFIQSWLAREQDNGGARASPAARTGMSAHGNTRPDGQARDYGQSQIPAWGQLEGGEKT